MQRKTRTSMLKVIRNEAEKCKQKEPEERIGGDY
jgi:hypothetical protein